MYLNTTSICGHLAADPMLQKGKREDERDDRCWFRVGVNRPGSDDADFFACVCWGKLARAVARYCSQGKEVIVHGSLRTRPQEVKDANGEVVLDASGRTVISNYSEIRCQHVSFGAESKKKRDAAAAADASTEDEALLAAVVAKVLAEQKAEQTADADADDCPFETEE
jgi:single-strand DNA-binding protein